MNIKKKFLDEIIRQALDEDPNECCGILAGNGEAISAVYPVKNSTPSPFRYVMDPKDQMNVMRETDDLGLDLIAFYHSHTHSPAYPSETDTRMAVESGWVDFCYVLVSLEKEDPEVKFYIVDENGNITEEEFEVTSATS